MAILNKEEKREFLKLAKSAQLKKDFKMLEKNRNEILLKQNRIDIDGYINFLNMANNFVNHKPKLFRKISGDNFKI